jgi:hypothetical protein
VADQVAEAKKRITNDVSGTLQDLNKEVKRLSVIVGLLTNEEIQTLQKRNRMRLIDKFVETGSITEEELEV